MGAGLTVPDENACRCRADVVARHEGNAALAIADEALPGRCIDLVAERLIVHMEEVQACAVFISCCSSSQ